MAAAWELAAADALPPALAELEAGVELSWLSRSAIRRLNAEARAVDAETDVLSFPLLDFGADAAEAAGPADFERDEEGQAVAVSLGDILICPEIAELQAAESGHSFERELAYLAVHGLLHLLGYEHEDEEAELRMRALASAAMEQSGLGLEAEPAAAGDGREAGGAAGEEPEFRAGFIALVGRPNVGKSTLLNQLAGNRLAIVSQKAQTTRHSIRAIVNRENAQFIFVDTPGLHEPRHRLGERMMRRSFAAVRDADAVLLLLDARAKVLYPEESAMIERARELGRPLLFVLNKIDLLAAKEQMLPLMSRLHAGYPESEIVPLSALEADGVTEMLDVLTPLLPVSPMLYEPDSFTDQTERQLVAEYLREQILLYVHDEIPHGTGVHIDSFEELFDDGERDGGEGIEEGEEEGRRSLVRIHASIVCDKERHKAILIGEGGRRLKMIGSAARRRMEELLGCPVYLETFVKVREDWRNRSSILNDYDIGRSSGAAADPADLAGR
ncbi:MAG: GTPase Era [Bacillota bacterium]|nr:GTPase Era [Bacillota bacterium]